MEPSVIRTLLLTTTLLGSIHATMAGADPCAGVSPVANTSLARVTVASGLTGRPLLVTAPPGDVDRIFIVEQNGFIRQLVRGAAPGGSTLWLDIDARVNSASDEQGLLGLAFHPDFQSNGFFFVNYTRADGSTVVSRFQTLGGSPLAAGDPASEKQLLRISQPAANHNGGHLQFGTDGYLYIGTGDGGSGGDPWGACGNGQNRQTLLGKLLRIDVDGGPGFAPDCGLETNIYTIPSDNPFAAGAGGDCDEIWSYGLRNPWRFDIDPSTGDFYIGDVGQGCWEEINYVSGSPTCVGGANVGQPCLIDANCPGSTCGPGGENYGWRQMEGTRCYNPGQGCNAVNAANCLPACNDLSLRLPILDYSRSAGNCSVTGGVIYRGCRMPNFDGTYFYGDYCAGSVRSFFVNAGVAANQTNWTALLGADLAFDLTSFGRDAQGEVYLLDRDGLVYKIVPPLPDFEVSGPGAGQPFLLSRDGDWTWENLQFSSGHPITSYRVLRADIADGVFDPGETFDCVHSTTATSWPLGGDPTVPAADRWLAYVVVARNAGGLQTSPGGSPPRTIGGAACP